MFLSFCFEMKLLTITVLRTKASIVTLKDSDMDISPPSPKANDDIVEKAEEHSRHPLGSEGSSCVACHMPRTVSGIKATMRDHSLAVPVPENTVDYGIPNACNLCHEERSPEWAADNIQAWFGNIEDRPDAMKFRRRAAAFSAAASALCS